MAISQRHKAESTSVTCKCELIDRSSTKIRMRIVSKKYFQNERNSFVTEYIKVVIIYTPYTLRHIRATKLAMIELEREKNQKFSYEFSPEFTYE